MKFEFLQCDVCKSFWDNDRKVTPEAEPRAIKPIILEEALFPNSKRHNSFRNHQSETKFKLPIFLFDCLVFSSLFCKYPTNEISA